MQCEVFLLWHAAWHQSAHLKRQVRRFSEKQLIRGRNVALNDANWLFTAERRVFY